MTGLFTVLRALNEQTAAYDDELARMVEETFPEAQRPKQVHARARACCWEASTFTLSPLRSPGDPADATRCSRGTKPIARSGDCPGSNEPSAGAASSPS